MSDDVKHSEDELGLATEPETDTTGDDVSTDAAEGTDESDDPSASLNLDESTKPSDAAKAAQIKGLGTKILTGELTYETFPPDQKWLLSDVVEFVSNAKGTTKEEPKLDKDEIRKEVEKLRDEEKFNDLLGKVKAAGLSSEENAEIQARFGELKSSGWSKLKRLEDTLKFLRIDLSQHRRKQPAMRVGGKVGGKVSTDVEDYSTDDVNAMSPERMAKMLG